MQAAPFFSGLLRQDLGKIEEKSFTKLWALDCWFSRTKSSAFFALKKGRCRLEVLYERRTHTTEGKLSALDLSEAKIVEGGDYYSSFTDYKVYTSNDEIGKYAFHDCSGLTSLTLPAGITSIGSRAFSYCI